MLQTTFKECLDLASRYQTEDEWRQGHPLHFKQALLKNWRRAINAMLGFERSEKWVLGRCQSDALRYPDRKAWLTAKSGGYNAAARNGWLHLCPHDEAKLGEIGGHYIPYDEITFDDCILEAARHNTRIEWFLKSKATFQKATDEGWRDLCYLVIGRQSVSPAAELPLKLEQVYRGNRQKKSA